jgi:Protein of unknown function (DUF3987)
MKSPSALSTPIPVTIFKDLGAKSKKEHMWSLRELLDEIEVTEASEKRELPLLKLASFGTSRTDKGSFRHDQNMVTVSGIEGDYDLEKISPEEAARLFKAAKIACVIYTSTSHTPDKPRWRVLAPFSDELLPDQRNQMLARINGLVGGTLSRESFTLSQAFYFGDVVGKHKVEIIEVEGDCIDLRDDLDAGAILPEIVKKQMAETGDRESTGLDEAQQLFDRDFESGKLQEALEEALDYRWKMGDAVGSDEDREFWWRNICWAIHHGSNGDKTGFKLWSDYATKSYRASRLKKRGDSVKRAIATEWHYAKDDRPAGVLGFGTVYKHLEEAGWVYGAIKVEDFYDDEEDEPESATPKPKADPKPVAPKSGIPARLLMIPGVLGKAVDHYNDTSTQHQPQYAVQTALALGSVILGRHWMTDTNNYTSLYLVNLGATGRGKEFARTFIENAMEEANLGYLIGPLKYVSEAGVMGQLAFSPRHITVYDEFGRLLSSTAGAGNTNLRDAQSIMMSLFGQLGGVARGAAYSVNGKTAQQVEQMRKTKIMRPAITMIGLSTPETFFDALSQDDVANGFLNRLLVVNTTQARQRGMPRAWKKVPRELLIWMKEYGHKDEDSTDFSEPGESATEVGEPEVVAYTPSARKMLNDIEDEVIALQNKFDDQRLDGMFSRSREIAMRIALIVAISQEKMKIDTEALSWAWDYVIFYTKEMVENVQQMMGATKLTRVAEILAAAVIKKGKAGMTMRDLRRTGVEFSKMEKRQTEEVLHLLKQQHDIHFVKAAKSIRGRPNERYMHMDFIQDQNE